MSQPFVRQVQNVETPDLDWKSLYKAGGLAALLAVMIFLLDMILSFGGEDFHPAPLTVVDWFELFQGNSLSGLRALGLLNILSLSISIALYLALFATLRQGRQGYAALAITLFLLGTAIYIANNAAIPMFVLSEKYAIAMTETQRTLFAAAGEALLARGADFAPGSFLGFFFTELAGFAFSVLMMSSKMFNKATAWAGILGFVLLSIFTIWQTFLPVGFGIAMAIAMLGGVSSVAWYLQTARKLLQLGQGKAGENRQSTFAVKGAG